jgi:hypothetical protein
VVGVGRVLNPNPSIFGSSDLRWVRRAFPSHRYADDS